MIMITIYKWLHIWLHMIIYDYIWLYTYAYRYTLYLASLGRVSSSRWLIHRLRKHICRYQRGHFHGASQSHYKIRQWKIQCSSAFMNHYRNKTWKFTFKHHITKKCSHLHKNALFSSIFQGKKFASCLSSTQNFVLFSRSVWFAKHCGSSH